MKKSSVIFGCLIVLFGVSLISASGKDTELTVFAAASLTDSMTQIGTLYEKEHNDIKVTLVFESSGVLQRQIENGAACDLFLSAGQMQMNALQEQELLMEDTRINLLKNSLTLISSKEKADAYIALGDDLATLIRAESTQYIAIGEPENVPVGQYTKEALTHAGLWNEAEALAVFGRNVKTVLTYVDQAEADLGFVYRTDAFLLKNGVILMDVPENLHHAILYPVAVLLDAPQQEEALRFFAFLQSATVQAIFESYGFSTVAQD